ncbi:hypothetical protein [Actinomadura gamaensis]|uniref:Uncharacterized protein n=1 Tax=Actinomadura gamaensis TaxID=1763541 RepID=A0ABV9U1N9_9ACTN
MDGINELGGEHPSEPHGLNHDQGRVSNDLWETIQRGAGREVRPTVRSEFDSRLWGPVVKRSREADDFLSKVQEVGQGGEAAFHDARLALQDFQAPDDPRIQVVAQGIGRASEVFKAMVSRGPGQSPQYMIIIFAEMDVVEQEAARAAKDETDEIWRNRWEKFTAEAGTIRKWVNLLSARLVTPAQVKVTGEIGGNWVVLAKASVELTYTAESTKHDPTGTQPNVTKT